MENDEKQRKEYRITKRAYFWSLQVIDLCEGLVDRGLGYIIFRQLVRSASSVVANTVEADSALSKKDFTKCLGIALKECNESKLWLQYVLDKKLAAKTIVIKLQNEAIEISKIIATIILKTKNLKHKV